MDRIRNALRILRSSAICRLEIEFGGNLKQTNPMAGRRRTVSVSRLDIPSSNAAKLTWMGDAYDRVAG